nr:hypothetical protein [Salinivirgaceae bacterium]
MNLKKNMKIISVVGARPNFMKIAPFINAIEEYNKNIDAGNAASQSSPLGELEGASLPLGG